MVASLRSKNVNTENITVATPLRDTGHTSGEQEPNDKNANVAEAEKKVVSALWQPPLLVIRGIQWHESILQAVKDAQNDANCQRAARVTLKKRKLDVFSHESGVNPISAASVKVKPELASQQSFSSTTSETNPSTRLPNSSKVRQAVNTSAPTGPASKDVPAPNDTSAPSPSPPRSPNTLLPTDLPGPYLAPSRFTSTCNSNLPQSPHPPLQAATAFTKPLTSHPPSTRTTATLLALAHNTFTALLAWQDEYLAHDRRLLSLLADHHSAQPPGLPQPAPRKPATGGRIPQSVKVWDDAKAAELAAAVLGDHLGASGAGGAGPAAANGRELRARRRAPRRFGGVELGPAPSEDDAGLGGGRRARRPAGLRFDGATGERRRGGGARQHALGRKAMLAAAIESAGASEAEGVRAEETSMGSEAGEESEGAVAARKGGPAAGVKLAPGRTVAAQSSGSRWQRAKSEKRAESMTLWWAERKRKAAEERRRMLVEQGGG